MASGTRQTNTQEELLRKLLPQIAEMKLSEDADPDFITELETRLIGKIREPIDRMKMMNMTGAAGGPGGMGGGMGVDPSMGQTAPGMPMDPALMGGGMPTQAPAGPSGIPPEILMQLAAAQQQQAAPQRGLSPSPDMAAGVDELRRLLTR